MLSVEHGFYSFVLNYSAISNSKNKQQPKILGNDSGKNLWIKMERKFENLYKLIKIKMEVDNN